MSGGGSPPNPIVARGLQVFVTAAGFEEALESELSGATGGPGRKLAAPGPRWPAVVSRLRAPARAGQSPEPPLDPAFALQQLPDALQVRGESVGELVKAAEGALGPLLEQAGLPFLVHAYVPEPGAYRRLAGRAELVGEAFLERLRRERLRLLKLRLPADVGELSPEQMLVQLALVGRGSLLCSAARPRPLATGGVDLSPWPAGSAPVAEDRRAPSRAYRKLCEGFSWMAARPSPGERVVDLGGSPGGWAFTALQLGAQVTAVDRSPLSPPAAGHPGLTMITGNAFNYRPAAPVEWLFCDVICEPARTLGLVETWMREGLCRRVVATLKFKGEGDYGLLAQVRARLATFGWPFLRLKHLRHHSNEVAILARR